jgi:TolB-like protein/tetratricopeptide (TPR) repeat protein
MSLLAELKRRNVIRMAGLYLVGAWLVTQVSGTLLPMFGAPEWVARSVVILLAIGLVPALVVAWVFELTPSGLKRDDEVTAAESIAPQTARRMDRMLLVVMALALGYFALDKFVLAPGRDASRSPLAATPIRTESAASVGARDANVVDSKSIAVLAFANLSEDRSNDYFSDGISEELLNVLAKVPALKVAARTSSFHFKGKDTPVPQIGRALGVAYVVEGSVRRVDDRVRITAQLIQATDGFNLWSESYDRELKDVFALQDEIAGMIASKLQLALGGTPRVATTVDPQAYGLVLEGRHHWGLRTAEGFARAEAAYLRALEIDPDFAQAHGGLAETYAIRGWFALLDGGLDASADFSRATTHAERALALDPALAEPHGALGAVAFQQRRYAAARQAFDRAFALNPNYAAAYGWSALARTCEGDLEGALRDIERGRNLDPLSAVMRNNHSWILSDTGLAAESLAAVEEAKRLRQGIFIPDYGRSAPLKLRLGRVEDAVADARTITQNPELAPRWDSDANTVYVLAQAGHLEEARAHADWGFARWPAGSYLRGWALQGLGDYEQAWQYLAAMPVTPSCRMMYDARWDPMRDDPRMVELMARLGLAEGYAKARALVARQRQAAAP